MCTSFLLKSSDGGSVYGRTLEFGLPLSSQIMVTPRNFPIQGVGVDGKPGTGLNWTSKYAVAGMNALGIAVYADGMNEKGLVGGMQSAPFTAQYQDVSQVDSGNSISSSQVLLYALSNFATVDEVKEGLSKIMVNRSPVAAFHNSVVTQRYPMHDASGKSIMIEYLNGELVITDNPTGVAANDPAFSQHLNNIGDYVNLTNIEQDSLVINGVTYGSPSSGNGLHGLPGDFLSTSRFIRALFFSKAVPLSFTTEQMNNAAWHVLGSFDIPPGAVTLPSSNPYGGGEGGIEITEWSVVADLKNMIYNVRTYETTNVYTFDFKKIDADTKELKFYKLDQVQATIQLN